MAISDNEEEQTGESVMEISSTSSVEEVEAVTEILPNATQATTPNGLTQLRDPPSSNGSRPSVDRLLPQAPASVENSQADFQLPSYPSVKKKSPDKKLDETVDETEVSPDSELASQFWNCLRSKVSRSNQFQTFWQRDINLNFAA